MIWLSGADIIRRIHQRVCKVKANEEVGVKYMQAWEEKYYTREEGREEGIKIGIRNKMIGLVQKKLQKGKPVSVIAEELEEEISVINEIIQEIEQQKEE